MASYDLPEVLDLISHFAQTFWISSYLSETPSRLPHPHPGCFRTGSGSLFSPFLAWPILFVKEALPSTYPVTCLSVCLSAQLSFILLLIQPPTNHPSVYPLTHLFIHISIYLPNHPPVYPSIPPSIPYIYPYVYPSIHLSAYPYI